MLIITRAPGQEVLIGDHSVVTVMAASEQDVRLGFNTVDSVRRVDNRNTAIASAQVKGRIATAKAKAPMDRPAVFVGVKKSEHEMDIRASLRPEMVQVAGYSVTRLSDHSKVGPANHEFVVVRTRGGDHAVRTMLEEGLLSWRFYEAAGQDDGSLLSLYIRATTNKTLADVRYLDLT